jgi:acyl transferase domain-containing protein/NAD(P)H-dependent flavin oxidoreductase YrpB (nitropropane dioxygenase family)/acyl carrier protein
MRDFSVISVTPAVPGGIAVPIAAARAGAWGIVDAVADRSTLVRTLRGLTRSGRDGLGLRLGTRQLGLLADIPDELLGALDVAILACDGDGPGAVGWGQDVSHAARRLKALQCRVLLEVIGVGPLGWAVEEAIDGIVAKGNESGGWVSEETSLVLLQHVLASSRLPVWVRGGIGLHSAAGCFAAGAAGVVLDSQLGLVRESGLPAALQSALRKMDGSETVCLGSELGAPVRVYAWPGLGADDELRTLASSLAEEPPETAVQAWRKAVMSRLGWDLPGAKMLPWGQESAFAGSLADRFVTVGGVVQALRDAVEDHVHAAKVARPLAPAAPLACAHGTRYPLVQGPMTRVSDRPEFAAAVADAGALPFLALALMRGADAERVLDETQSLLGDRPWGVGILGFVPEKLRSEQMEAIRGHRPAVALIAGGRPDQALTLEEDGIPTYLHVPSPRLLSLFADQGARRFVFEGRECGGHVGPRSSLVLWDLMQDALIESLPESELAKCHVLLAGGIHDDVSAAAAAVTAGSLSARGVKVGFLLGTAYLFTHDVVTSGAVTPGFQREAAECTGTVLLDSGPGHATRCAETPFVASFRATRRRLLGEGKREPEVAAALEELSLGRLRLAAKGVQRSSAHCPAEQPELVPADDAEQRRLGMYMLGQVAALRTTTCSLDELHESVAVQGSERIDRLAGPIRDRTAHQLVRHEDRHSGIAIVGMSCLLPKAPDLSSYWRNILGKVDAIGEVPEERWDWRRYAGPGGEARDSVRSHTGGFLEPVVFDPVRYGIPPSSLPSIEPLQLLALEAVRAALDDAGYASRPFAQDRTSVILGVGGGIADLGQQYAVRSGLPLLLEDIPEGVFSKLPEWTEDSFAGVLLNVTAGRIANRFDFGGLNFTVDAACASSLAAVHLAVRELETGESDLVIAGGADTVQNPFGYLCFSTAGALSPTGRCRPFDAEADGITISEGLGILVLKRLEDAERDGDRVYAVLRGVAGSSDGRARGTTAPSPEGQLIALRRAYERAGVSPATVELLEAHGTGTPAGDEAEVAALHEMYTAAGASPRGCVLGSVKSMIGHTKCAAGVASLIKVAQALHRQVLPPTLHVQRPASALTKPDSPFYLIADARPWVHSSSEPRRAAVSSFGFGGTNFHAVLEAYADDRDLPLPAACDDWPTELFVWRGERAEVAAQVAALDKVLAGAGHPALRDLAATVCASAPHSGAVTSAIVAEGVADLRRKLTVLRRALLAPNSDLSDDSGVHVGATEEPPGHIAFLFPGQGSQHPGMLRELSVHFSEVRERWERADAVLAQRFPRPLSSYVFPPTPFQPQERREHADALTETTIAQPALGAAGLAAFRLLTALGVQPEMVAGHSYGELPALCAAGVIEEDTLYRLSETRGRAIGEVSGPGAGVMVAVSAGPEQIGGLLSGLAGVWLANLNAPAQTVISGTREGVGAATARLQEAGYDCSQLPVACAFHSPLVAPAADRLSEALAGTEISQPSLAVYANATAAPYPAEPGAIRELLARHLLSPVRFRDEVDAMHRAGARIFIEAGPRAILTRLVEQTLDTRPHLAIALDGTPSGARQLQTALARLAAAGVPIRPERLFRGRACRLLDLHRLAGTAPAAPSPTAWLVSGGSARPVRPSQTPTSRPAREAEDAPARGVSALRSSNGSEGRTGAAVVPPRESSPAPAVRETGATKPFHQVYSPTEGPAMSQIDSLSVSADQVMMQYQQIMGRFLVAQERVMLAYLQSAPGDDGHWDGELAMGISSNGDRSGGFPVLESPSPAPRPHLPVPSTVDLPAVPDAPQAVPTPQEPASPEALAGAGEEAGEEALAKRLLEIISDRTGYPVDFLNPDLELAADLGIDSIKKVEILGTFQRATGLQGSAMMKGMEKIKTIRHVIAAVASLVANAEGERDAASVAVNGAEVRPERSWASSAAGSPADRHEPPRFVPGSVDAP